jgi:hypothetical protein
VRHAIGIICPTCQAPVNQFCGPSGQIHSEREGVAAKIFDRGDRVIVTERESPHEARHGTVIAVYDDRGGMPPGFVRVALDVEHGRPSAPATIETKFLLHEHRRAS